MKRSVVYVKAWELITNGNNYRLNRSLSTAIAFIEVFLSFFGHCLAWFATYGLVGHSDARQRRDGSKEISLYFYAGILPILFQRRQQQGASIPAIGRVC